MAKSKSLLVELGTEELPPRALDALGAAFLRDLSGALAKAGVHAGLDDARAYVTPRRLAVYIPDVATMQPAQTLERRGPALAAGLDAAGQPTPALLGFARSCGVEVDALERLETDKGAWFVARTVRPGQPLAALLPGMVDEALKGLPVPRPMRWADHDYSFVRPVHWLLMLHGDSIVDGEVLGLASGRRSYGHRFMHPQPVHVAESDSWLDAMRMANVLADPAERRGRIQDEVARAAVATGGTPHLDEALLDELANLTEWPVAIACTFDPAFLDVPPEALVATMVVHQKFVPVFAADGRLTEHFIGVANIDSADPGAIRRGYERVIRPRFADAKFFWDADLRTPLSAHCAALAKVTYQQALGSLADKSKRIGALARSIAAEVGADVEATARAASLCKCDLLTRMVGEFPELQGVMGRHYAEHSGEAPAVAAALDSYYRPRFGGDAIAPDRVGQVLSVADRLDTLAGIFAVGLKPSGSKDPFALRRVALGLARTLIEGELELGLQASLEAALQQLPEAALAAGIKPGKNGKPVPLDATRRRAELRDELLAFIIERLHGYYTAQGFDHGQLEAVLAVDPPSLLDFDRRLRAVLAFGRLPEAMKLAAANKRVANILRQQAEAGGVAVASEVDPACFEHDSERALAAALVSAREETAVALEARDYAAVLTRLARLQAPVDAFFEGVLVNAEDPRVRANRLALLAQLKAQFASVADIALL
ncbi:MAG TPA: glycine--tRNA ligase subunit beta [Rhodanobacter sp.]|nr:glycine--tRNA ligase subunit beta [Rhodanobacter sp.]